MYETPKLLRILRSITESLPEIQGMLGLAFRYCFLRSSGASGFMISQYRSQQTCAPP